MVWIRGGTDCGSCARGARLVAAYEVGAEVWALVGWGGDLRGVAAAGAEEAEGEEGEEDAC